MKPENERSKRKRLLLRGAAIVFVMMAVWLVATIPLTSGCELTPAIDKGGMPGNADGLQYETVGVSVDWRKMPEMAVLGVTNATGVAKDFLESIKLTKTYPIQPDDNPWNSRKLKLVFMARGSLGGEQREAKADAVVELTVMPGDALRLKVSKIDSVETMLFDAAGAKVDAQTDSLDAAIKAIASGTLFEMLGYSGFAEADLCDGKVWCHDNRIEIKIVRTKEQE